MFIQRKGSLLYVLNIVVCCFFCRVCWIKVWC